QLEVERLSFFVQRARRPADAGAAHRHAQRAEARRRFDRLAHFVGRGHVGLDETRLAFERLLQRRTALLVTIDDDHARPAGHEPPHRRFAEPRGSAGHQRYRSIELHVRVLQLSRKHTTPLDTLVSALPEGRGGDRARPARSHVLSDGIGLALSAAMLRTLVLALACVLVAAPAAQAKKRKAHAHVAKRAKKAKRSPKAFARVQPAPPPTRVAAAEQHPAPPPVEHPAPAVEHAAPEATPAPSPPVEHGPMGPQATDDEVPGSKMKKR